MAKPLAFRMIRETIYFYQSQILRLESLSLRTGMNKSEILRLALEAFLRFHDLKDPEFRVLPNEMEEEKVPEYKGKFMEPFVEILQEEMGEMAEKEEKKETEEMQEEMQEEMEEKGRD